MTARLKAEVSVPVCASNRINTPELAEDILAAGGADLVSMARPLLADPDFVAQGRRGSRRRDQHLHRLQPGLPRPRVRQQARPPAWSTRGPAARPSLVLLPLPTPRGRARVAVVGAGPAGLAAAVSAAERGFAVTLFERSDAIGGQFRLAMAVPGKEDFAETLRYYAPPARGARRRRCGSATEATAGGPRGCTTRSSSPPASCRGCPTSTGSTTRGGVVRRRAQRARRPGRRVAVIGAGGIGVDVVDFLAHDPADGFDDWMAHWGVGDPAVHPGGLTEPKPRTPVREVTLLQRKTHADRHRPRQDLRLGAPRRAQAVGRRRWSAA